MTDSFPFPISHHRTELNGNLYQVEVYQNGGVVWRKYGTHEVVRVKYGSGDQIMFQDGKPSIVWDEQGQCYELNN